jgi:hypothetical protein
VRKTGAEASGLDPDRKAREKRVGGGRKRERKEFANGGDFGRGRLSGGLYREDDGADGVES